jgi:hypothetical protein
VDPAIFGATRLKRLVMQISGKGHGKRQENEQAETKLSARQE